MRSILRFIRSILVLVLLFVLTINVILFIQSKISVGNFPSIFGYNYLKVVSGSMEPTIKINDIVIVKAIESNSVKVNDIIVYKENNYYVTHRITSMDENNIYMKGDANSSGETITKNQVVAKVIYYDDTVSDILNIITKPIILVLMTILIIIIPKD